MTYKEALSQQKGEYVFYLNGEQIRVENTGNYYIGTAPFPNLIETEKRYILECRVGGKTSVKEYGKTFKIDLEETAILNGTEEVLQKIIYYKLVEKGVIKPKQF